MKKALLIPGILVLLTSGAFAEDVNVNLGGAAIVAEVVQEQFTFDASNIKAASIIDLNNTYKGLHVELKPEAVSAFTKMSQAGMGKRINIVLNQKIVSTNIIQTALGSNLLITGISREDAQKFIESLKYTDSHSQHADAAPVTQPSSYQQFASNERSTAANPAAELPIADASQMPTPGQAAKPTTVTPAEAPMIESDNTKNPALTHKAGPQPIFEDQFPEMQNPKAAPPQEKGINMGQVEPRIESGAENQLQDLSNVPNTPQIPEQTEASAKQGDDVINDSEFITQE